MTDEKFLREAPYTDRFDAKIKTGTKPPAPEGAGDMHFDNANTLSLSDGSGSWISYFLAQGNTVATSAPSATDDATAGYSVGSMWIDVTNDMAYICLDSTSTSAIWQPLGGGGSVPSGTTKVRSWLLGISNGPFDTTQTDVMWSVDPYDYDPDNLHDTSTTQDIVIDVTGTYYVSFSLYGRAETTSSRLIVTLHMNGENIGRKAFVTDTGSGNDYYSYGAEMWIGTLQANDTLKLSLFTSTSGGFELASNGWQGGFSEFKLMQVAS